MAAPPHFENLGLTSASNIQGLALQIYDSRGNDPLGCVLPFSGYQVLSLQGHPEFTTQTSKDIIGAFSKMGVINQDDALLGLQMADVADDGIGVVGRAIWDFFGLKCN